MRKLPSRNRVGFVEAQGADVDLVVEGWELAGDTEVSSKAESVSAAVAYRIRGPVGEGKIQFSAEETGK